MARNGNGKVTLEDLERMAQSSSLAPEVRAALGYALKKGRFSTRMVPPQGRFPSLVEVTGPGFKPKRLSPRLLLAVLDNAEAVRNACEQAVQS